MNVESRGIRTELYPPIVSGDENPVSIQYNVGHRTPLTLAIYDARGRLVRTLDQGTREVGTHSRLWERVDDSGRRVSKGVYFVRLEAGRFEASRKLVVQ